MLEELYWVVICIFLLFNFLITPHSHTHEIGELLMTAGISDVTGHICNIHLWGNQEENIRFSTSPTSLYTIHFDC